ncbi:MAG: Asp23/Gls24 family envelope stress response protein [Hydrogenoanaerobacterium sp.]
MVKLTTHLGTTNISQVYFANLVGHVASECFGVAGMSNTDATQGLRTMLTQKESPDHGVRVRLDGNKLLVDLHIIVSYGVNISAIVKSIVNKVRYSIEEATDMEVAKVNVFVDSMKTE